MSDVRAADLPEWSVVAVTHKAWIKDYRSGLTTLPWSGTGMEGGIADQIVDDLLADDAKVLRVGDGSNQ